MCAIKVSQLKRRESESNDVVFDSRDDLIGAAGNEVGVDVGVGVGVRVGVGNNALASETAS